MFMSHVNTAAIIVRLRWVFVISWRMQWPRDFNTLLTALDIFFCQTDAKLCHDVVLWSAETTKQRRFGGILLFNSMLQKAKGKELN